MEFDQKDMFQFLVQLCMIEMRKFGYRSKLKKKRKKTNPNFIVKNWQLYIYNIYKFKKGSTHFLYNDEIKLMPGYSSKTKNTGLLILFIPRDRVWVKHLKFLN